MKTDEEKAIEDRMGARAFVIFALLVAGSVAAGVAASSAALGIAVFTLILAVFEFVEYQTTVILMWRKKG